MLLNVFPEQMKINLSLCILTLTALLFANCSKPDSQLLLYERLKLCNSEGLDSTVLCGTLSVFENRQTRAGRKINLNITVIPAMRRDAAKSPIFFLEGGPGVAATFAAGDYADSINHYRLNHDIVLIDVRGTGQSNPLHCRQLQYKEHLEQQLEEMYPVVAVKDCYDSLSKFADLTQYTTTNIATDIDEVRKWLGYEKISLFGLSYGTRLAQVYMKMFPDAVESCVLWSPTTIYSRMPLYHAQFAQESLEKLFEDCKADSLCSRSFPNINEEFNTLHARGIEKPFRYKSEGEEKEITIPWYAFHTKIRSLMYSPYGLRRLPYIIHESSKGNWEPFISLFPEGSSYDDFLAEGLYLCVTCTEDVPFISNEEVVSLTKDTFLGDYRVAQQRQACANWISGVVPEGFFEPLVSDIPTLIFSGYFDPVTPPSMAEQILRTLSNGHLITIAGMSHLYDGLANPGCFDRIVVDFFDNPSVKPNGDCTKQMMPGEYWTGD
jgi:pimeloyl-ACP methyl ester carboxylesterase